MFKSTLRNFIDQHGSHWSLETSDDVCTELVRAHIMGGLWQMRRTLARHTDKKMATLIEDEIAARFQTDAGFFNLWRALMDVILSDRSVAEVAIRHKVDPEDIYYEYDHLTGAQLQIMANQAEAEKWCVDPIDPKKYAILARQLHKFAKSQAARRLSFLTNYDIGMDQEDCTHDLWLKGCRLLQMKWHLPSDNSRLNLARRAIVNEALNLIKYHTQEDRRRLGSVLVTGPYTSEGTPHRQYERFVTTLSLDHSDPDTPKLSLHNMCVDPQSSDDLRHAYEMIRSIGQNLDQRYKTFLEIVSLELLPTEFEQYVLNKYNKTLEEATLKKIRPKYWKGRKPKRDDYQYVINYPKLGRLAMDWLHLNPRDVQRILGTRLQRIIGTQGGTDVSVFNTTVGRAENLFFEVAS